MKQISIKNVSSRKHGFKVRTLFRLGKLIVVSLPLFWEKNIDWIKEGQLVSLHLKNDMITIIPFQKVREVKKQ